MGLQQLNSSSLLERIFIIVPLLIAFLKLNGIDNAKRDLQKVPKYIAIKLYEWIGIANAIIIAHCTRNVGFAGKSPFTGKLRSSINDDLACNSTFLKPHSLDAKKKSMSWD
ncbi:hypothetical protein [Legionella drancourtii]|uniref:Uncharacterized protein n=1 Tax=Legionella drancourtii LLAP12 TaxID=658187 RepID=G9EKN5_9GAMM|nr:hypothetical protein [Legionella drancourtii]EHL32168.1 hypothetical protein LDG_5772 [Legionella drancourtii LLAP12]